MVMLSVKSRTAGIFQMTVALHDETSFELPVQNLDPDECVSMWNFINDECFHWKEDTMMEMYLWWAHLPKIERDAYTTKLYMAATTATMEERFNLRVRLFWELLGNSRLPKGTRLADVIVEDHIRDFVGADIWQKKTQWDPLRLSLDIKRNY
jgi:hypothetical protein